MKRLVVTVSFLLLGVTSAFAGADGYRNCSLKQLAACESSNQIFWATAGKKGKTVRRAEFHKALATFLHGAPPLFIGKTPFEPAQIAPNSFVGPGDHHDHLPGGGWFFDGFTPHDATERCAILFNADGDIQLVALLNMEQSEAGPDTFAPDRFYLHIYSRDAAPDEAGLQFVRTWAKNQLKSGTGTPQPRLAATDLFNRTKNKWTGRVLP